MFEGSRARRLSIIPRFYYSFATNSQCGSRIRSPSMQRCCGQHLACASLVSCGQGRCSCSLRHCTLTLGVCFSMFALTRCEMCASFFVTAARLALQCSHRYSSRFMCPSVCPNKINFYVRSYQPVIYSAYRLCTTIIL